AAMKPRGKRRSLIGKFSTARCVCAPHSASAGTCISPSESFSVRYFVSLMVPRFARHGCVLLPALPHEHNLYLPPTMPRAAPFHAEPQWSQRRRGCVVVLAP